MLLRFTSLGLLLLTAACASGNPPRSQLEPAPLPGERPAEPPAEPVAAAPREVPEAQAPEELAARTAPQPVFTKRVAGNLSADGDAPLAIAVVAGHPVDARDLLKRLWLSRTNLINEDILQLVEAQLFQLEAARMGITLDPDLVERETEERYDAILADAREEGLTVTLDEYIRMRRGVDPEFFRRETRKDVIVRLIASRTLRAWILQHERAVVRLMRLEAPEEAESLKMAVAGGASFIDLATAREAEDGSSARRLVVVRSEHSPIARLAFATPVGMLEGPIPEGDAFLLMFVEERLPALEGQWYELADRVEESLTEAGIDDYEYVQWVEAMRRRYEVDITPFLRLVGERTE